jgi:ubiquinone/menaquinone biosynthesis C-methylase UbiE
MSEYLSPVRKKVLQHATIQDSDVVLDVGTGDGLIAFGALQHNLHCHVMFSDVSQILLTQTQELAHDMHVLDRCQFILALAEDVQPITNVSINVVTTRSALAYLWDMKA